MKDIELPPLSKFDHPEPRTMQWSDLELYAIKSYARAAVEADRAQRVPDGWVLIATDAYEAGFGKGEQAHKTGKDVENPWGDEPGREAWAMGYALGKERAASTPAPAQQERGPMTEQEFEALHFKERGYVATGLMDIVAMVERHHGIRKD